MTPHQRATHFSQVIIQAAEHLGLTYAEVAGNMLTGSIAFATEAGYTEEEYLKAVRIALDNGIPFTSPPVGS